MLCLEQNKIVDICSNLCGGKREDWNLTETKHWKLPECSKILKYYLKIKGQNENFKEFYSINLIDSEAKPVTNLISNSLIVHLDLSIEYS